jgi:hypothetical protein
LAGAAHAVQPLAEHPDATLLLATHEVGFAAGQPWLPAAQVTPQTAPLQAGAPPAGAAHAVQPPAVHPDATLLLAMHVPAAAVPHRWKPALQARAHAPAVLQVTVPLAGAVQTVQLSPHDVTAVLPLMMQAEPQA